MKLLDIQISEHSGHYSIHIGEGLLESLSAIADQSGKFHQVSKAFLISNEKVSDLYAEVVEREIAKLGFSCVKFLMPDGEEYKNQETLFAALNEMASAGIRRTDVVIALGGGVVGDLAGLVSSLYMRGLGLIQIPTTLLSMVDSSVGGKTAVNLQTGKNLVGTFKNPDLVITDYTTLATLDPREIRAGYYELIKQGAVGSMDLLNLTKDFLDRFGLDQFRENLSETSFKHEFEKLLVAQISQKARVVESDALESPENDARTSRKILNFGHTVGHALERVTDYKYFKHGEAVGYGMLAALEISKSLEICAPDSIKLLNNVVRSVGQLPDASKIDASQVCEAIALDKKSTGSSVKWVLIERVGEPLIVDGSRISDDLIQKSLNVALL